MSRLSFALHALTGAACGAAVVYSLPWTFSLLARLAPVAGS